MSGDFPVTLSTGALLSFGEERFTACSAAPPSEHVMCLAVTFMAATSASDEDFAAPTRPLSGLLVLGVVERLERSLLILRV